MRLIDIAYGLFVMLTMLAVINPAGGQDEETLSTLAEVTDVIPESARLRMNPVPPSDESLEHGLFLFSGQCVMCHGASGDGSGDLALRLSIKMPDFTHVKKSSERTDGELFYILTEGHGKMRGDGERFPEEWRWDVINAIREMAGTQR